MIYYLLGSFLILVVVLFCNQCRTNQFVEDKIAQAYREYEDDLQSDVMDETRIGWYRHSFWRNLCGVILTGMLNNALSAFYSVYDIFTSFFKGAVPPPAEVILAAALASEVPKAIGQFNTCDNHFVNEEVSVPQEQQLDEKKELNQQEDQQENEEELKHAQQLRGWRRKDKRKKKKRRKNHGQRRRHEVKKPLQNVAHREEKEPEQLDVNEEDKKLPPAVEQLLRLDRDATKMTMLEFDNWFESAYNVGEKLPVTFTKFTSLNNSDNKSFL